MPKRYNLQIIEMDDKPIMDPMFGPKVVYEEELIVKRISESNGVFIDNLIHTMFVSIENAIEDNE